MDTSEMYDNLKALADLYKKNPLLREMKEYQESRFTEDVEFELDVPSGKIIISADLSDQFDLNPETEKRETAWRIIMYSHRTQDFAKENSAWVNIYENYPRLIMQPDGTLTFDRLARPDDDYFKDGQEDFETDEEETAFYMSQLAEGEVMLPYYPTGNFMHLTDYDEWVKRGGNPDDVLTGDAATNAEEYDVVAIDIPAGRYKFTSYSVNDNFWGPTQMPTDISNNRGRVCFAKMSIMKE